MFVIPAPWSWSLWYALKYACTTYLCCHSVAQSCLFGTTWAAVCQASLSFTVSGVCSDSCPFMSSDGYLTVSSSASLIFFAISLSEHQGLFQGVISSHLHSYSIAKFNDIGGKGAVIPETTLLQGMTSEPFNSWFIFTQLVWLTFPSLFQCRCLTPLVSSFCDLSSIPHHYGFPLKNSLFFLELPDVSYRNVCTIFFINYPTSHLSFQRQLVSLTNTNIKNKMRDPWKAWVQSDT